MSCCGRPTVLYIVKSALPTNYYDCRADAYTHPLARGHDFSRPLPGRTPYLSILASHVILSIVALPMALTTLFFLLTSPFAMHRRIARVTFPIWLYVSI